MMRTTRILVTTTILTIVMMAVASVQAYASNLLRPIEVDQTVRQSYTPSPYPDRIILTWTGDPATTQAVTWRTDTTITEAIAEIAPDDGSPYFVDNAMQFTATSETIELQSYTVTYHTVDFTGLEPDTLYAYRVGDGSIWSEWSQFRTAKEIADPFSFIYVGDAQNNIQSMWTRVIRQAYARIPDARFILHAGDLINDDQSDSEWGEWFAAVRGIHTNIPCIATTGNHEYSHLELTPQWRPQFAFPLNGPEVDALSETVYYIDYQNVRIISLNTHVMNQEIIPRLTNAQVAWLREVLENNPNEWTIVTHHHPMYASAAGRTGHYRLNVRFKLLYEFYGVDLVLQGHDHSYARGELTSRLGRAFGFDSPTYVVSVSGPKMYELDAEWAEVSAEGLQCYQHISIDGNTLVYKAYTVAGELVDAFYMVKHDNGEKELVYLPE